MQVLDTCAKVCNKTIIAQLSPVLPRLLRVGSVIATQHITVVSTAFYFLLNKNKFIFVFFQNH